MQGNLFLLPLTKAALGGATALLVSLAALDLANAQEPQKAQPERFGPVQTEGTVTVEDKSVPMRDIVGRNVVSSQNETVGEIVAVTPTDIIIRTGGMTAKTVGIEIAELKTRSGPTTVYVVDQQTLSTAPEVTFDTSRRTWSAK